MEPDHPVAHLFHHPADLPVLALHQNDAETIAGEAVNPGRPGHDTGQGHAFFHGRKGLIGKGPLNGHVVLFFVIEGGVREAVMDAAIVGHQQQTGGILVQPSHRKKPLGQVDQVRHHRFPPVLAAGHDAFGLVEHHIDEPIRFAHRYAVELHHIGLGIDPGT